MNRSSEQLLTEANEVKENIQEAKDKFMAEVERLDELYRVDTSEMSSEAIKKYLNELRAAVLATENASEIVRKEEAEGKIKLDELDDEAEETGDATEDIQRQISDLNSCTFESKDEVVQKLEELSEEKRSELNQILQMIETLDDTIQRRR